MFKKVSVVAVGLGVLLAAGCSRKPEPTVNESMTEIMAPQAQTVWDTTSKAFNDVGDGLEASKLTDKDWADLETAGKQLKERALLIARHPHVKVAAAGEAVMGADASKEPSDIGHQWDAATARQIQARIDAKPDLFAQKARVLAQSGATIEQAAKTRDVRSLYEVSSSLDEVCDGCHEKFWGTDVPPPFPH